MARERWTRLTPGTDDRDDVIMCRQAVGIDGLCLSEGCQGGGVLYPTHRQIVLDMDEIRAIPPMHRLIKALTNHEDRSLWWLGWVNTLVKEYEKEHMWCQDEDPDATREAIQTVKLGLYTLMGEVGT